MTPARRDLVRTSNGVDPRKNTCAVAVTDFLGVTDRVRYLHTVADIVRASRTLYLVTRIKHPPFVGREVSTLCEWLATHPQEVRAILVRVSLHAILLGGDGTVLVDSDSPAGSRDRRKVTHLYRISDRK